MSLFTKEEKKVIKEYYKFMPLIKNKNKLIEFIKKFVKIKKLETEKYGEILTPFNLINDILNKLEEIDKDIFKKSYSWFDPCAGMGNFHIMIYFRLIKYHKHNNIIKNLFYANEINKKNVFLYKLIFGENANINCGDSLKLNEELKYDIIIGNPPYNSGTKNTGTTIYQQFIKKFINQFNKYFSFINPPGWRKPNNENCRTYGLYELMTKENNLLYLEIHNNKDGKKTFNAGTRYDWYIITKNNNKNNKISIIKDEKNIINKINCNNWKFLPNYNFNNIMKIIDFNKNNTLKVIHTSYYMSTKNKIIKKEKDKEFKYPLIHSLTGPVILYTNQYNKDIFIKNKIILGMTNLNNYILDKNGKYGLTEMTVYIEDENIDIIYKNLYKLKEIYNAFNYASFRLEWRIFEYVKKDFYNYI